MERARLEQRDHEESDRNAQLRPTDSDRLTCLEDERRSYAPSPSRGTTYGSTTASGEATVIVGDNYGPLVTHHHPSRHSRQPFDLLLESLAFDRIHARIGNVAQALPNTCHWLFRHHYFIAWQTVPSFLWIKGKPGSGKSTVMKEVHDWVEKSWATHCVLSYFFNARSPQAIEKSPLGLYRSLLHQLLSKSPVGGPLFTSRFRSKIKTEHTKGVETEPRVTEEWTETELQNFFIDLFRMNELPPITVLIDALDEGQDDQVRSMIRFFERLTRHAETSGVLVRICFSSRHYPNITVRTPLEIILEDQAGQREDIKTYISSELLIDTDSVRADDLRSTILDRSNGVFLWVVLVIQILNTVHDQGKGTQAMWQTLSGIPNDLHQLFADILSRDAETDKCITLFRWILFSEKPMRTDDLYLIIHHIHHEELEENVLPNPLIVHRYLLNCSRGLAESTKTIPSVMQFIHETVRDYLLIAALAPTPDLDEMETDALIGSLKSATSHGILAKNCLEYLLHICSLSNSYMQVRSATSLLSYAAHSWWKHASKSETAHHQDILRLALAIFLSYRNFRTWVAFGGASLGIDPEYGNSMTALQCAALIGMPALVTNLLPSETIDATNLHSGTALQAAAEKGHQAVVQILLEAGADVYRLGGPNYDSPLEVASEMGHANIVKLLLNSMADNESQAKHGRALFYASGRGRVRVVRMLLEDGADPTYIFAGIETALDIASRKGFKNIVQLLLSATPTYVKTSSNRAPGR